ncbi:MAG: U32 family peptidase [Rhodospirillales bacterium]
MAMRGAMSGGAVSGDAKLTMGPVLFNWPPEKWRDFYFRVADEAPIDTVCVGEVVCSKRAPFFDEHLAEVVERLENGGKEVVLSTLALIMNEREMAAVNDIAECEDYLVEANDIATSAAMKGRPHAIGPLVNVYNEGTLAYLASMGAKRICLPVELPAGSLGVLAKAQAVELEVQVFGRMQLALSARCYHARSRGLAKDNCQYVCQEDADGMDIETLDDTPFLAVNGTQTLSNAYCNLIHELDALMEMGIRRFRISPHDMDMVATAITFRDVLDGRQDAAWAEGVLAGLSGGAGFCNGFFHGLEGDAFISPQDTAARGVL